MKKVIALIGIYLIIIIISTSCKEEHYLITDIRFLGASINYYGDEPRFNVYDSTSVFNTGIIFVISNSTDFVASLLDFDLIQNCYAYTPKRIYDNELLHDSYSITFNRPFVFDNDTIDYGVNIFSISNIKKEINIFETAMAFESSGADEIIDFSNNFIDKVEFDDEKYQVTFSCRTSDNREFVEVIDVEFRL